LLDIKFIERHADEVAENARVRGADVDVKAIVELESERRAVTVEAEELRRQINQQAKQWRGAGDPEEHRAAAQELKQREREATARLRVLREDLDERMSWLPNMLDPRVPIGGDEQDVVIREVGTIPEFGFEPRSHDQLAEALGLLDIARGVKLAKSRFYCLMREAVELRYALTRMFSDLVAHEDWVLVSPPYMAKDATLFASGYLPFGARDNFRIEGEDLSLIGTSEQALLGMHLDETLTELPLLYLGDSMCFRTEAGSYGRDTSGILRVHQFFKLEQIVYCRPDDAEEWHLRCLENEERMLQRLELPYRVVITSSGDLAAAGRLKYDAEAWFPSQGRYRELTSNTNLTDYQTRRGKIRYKDATDRGFPYTISATAFTDRHILSLLENHQRADGSIGIPAALQPYMNGRTEITGRRERAAGALEARA
jgi:seryl-tRNA synthetase